MAFYNPNRSSNWNYGGSNWKLSRSKIDLFRQCPRCFYIDNKLGTKRPSMPSFEINKAVDNQLKQEFDSYRLNDQQHPLQTEYGIDAKPAPHDLLNTWRENFEGVQTLHQPTGLIVSGAIDDLWINSQGEYIVVDYKATAKTEPVTKLDSEWHEAYRKQIEVYQWLLRQNGLKVSDIGYFVYCTGKYDQKSFDKVIEFDIVLIPYQGSDAWVEDTLLQIKACLESSTIPKSGKDCEHCMWWNARAKYEQSTVEIKTVSTTKIVSKPRAKKVIKKSDEATLF